MLGILTPISYPNKIQSQHSVPSGYQPGIAGTPDTFTKSPTSAVTGQGSLGLDAKETEQFKSCFSQKGLKELGIKLAQEPDFPMNYIKLMEFLYPAKMKEECVLNFKNADHINLGTTERIKAKDIQCNKAVFYDGAQVRGSVMGKSVKMKDKARVDGDVKAIKHFEMSGNAAIGSEDGKKGENLTLVGENSFLFGFTPPVAHLYGSDIKINGNIIFPKGGELLLYPDKNGQYPDIKDKITGDVKPEYIPFEISPEAMQTKKSS